MAGWRDAPLLDEEKESKAESWRDAPEVSWRDAPEVPEVEALGPAATEINQATADEKERVLGIARGALGQAPFPTIRGGVLSGGARLLSGVARVTGQDAKADFWSRYSGALLQVVGERAEEPGRVVPPIVKRGLAGALATGPTMAVAAPLGPYGMIAGGALSEADSAITEGRDAGLRGKKLAAYSARQGVIEGTIAGAMQKVGLGGLEKIVGGKAAVSNGIRQTLKQGKTLRGAAKGAARDFLHEEIEEVATSVLQTLNTKYSGVDESEITLKSLASVAAETTSQVAWTMFGVTVPNIAAQVTEGRRAKAEQEIVASAESGKAPSRKQAKEWGLPVDKIRSAKDRQQAAQELASEIQAEREVPVKQEVGVTPEAAPETLAEPAFEPAEVTPWEKQTPEQREGIDLMRGALGLPGEIAPGQIEGTGWKEDFLQEAASSGRYSKKRGMDAPVDLPELSKFYTLRPGDIVFRKYRSGWALDEGTKSSKAVKKFATGEEAAEDFLRKRMEAEAVPEAALEAPVTSKKFQADFRENSKPAIRFKSGEIIEAGNKETHAEAFAKAQEQGLEVDDTVEPGWTYKGKFASKDELLAGRSLQGQGLISENVQGVTVGGKFPESIVPAAFVAPPTEPTWEPEGPAPKAEGEIQQFIKGSEGKIGVSVKALSKGIGFTKHAMQRFLTSRGELPQSVFNEKVRRDGTMSRIQRDMAYKIKDYDRAIKEAYPSRELTQQEVQAYDGALKGEVPLESLPENMREPVGIMRNNIDALSRRAIDIGAISGKLEGTVVENMGMYVNRSYRVYDDPKWADKVPADIRNKAKALLRQEYINTGVMAGISTKQTRKQIRIENRIIKFAKSSKPLSRNQWRFYGFNESDWGTPKQRIEIIKKRAEGIILNRKTSVLNYEDRINGLIEKLLYEGTAAESPIAAIREAMLGSKDLSILTQRKDIPREIRALLGEYQDPRLNYAKTMTKLGGLIANHQFLAQVRELGMGNFFSEIPIVNDKGELKTRIDADESSAMYPLNSLYTTPEIKDAFIRATEKGGGMPGWVRFALAANAIVKLNKTVFSLMTHVRNFVANAGFAVMNGHWRAGNMPGSFKAVITNLGKLNNIEFREYYLRAVELGIVGQDVHVGELQDHIRDASKKDLNEFAYDLEKRRAYKTKSAIKAITGTVADLYIAEDDVWKLYAWENEKARYSEAMPELSYIEIEERCAEIVSNTYPTYSRVPEGIKALRRFPLMGAFVSFPAEVVRTAYNTVDLAQQELRDPRLRKIGAERAVGSMMAMTAASGIATATRMLFGVSKDDDDDMRHFVPPWQGNSEFAHLGRTKAGNIRYVDLAYSDPHNTLITPVKALLGGHDIKEGVWNAMKDIAAPFAGEDILFGKFVDVWSNNDAGRKVFNPQDSVNSQAIDVAAHLWSAFEPGTLTSARRIAKGVTGTKTATGQTYNPTIETIAVATGQRLQELDIAQSLQWRARDFAREIRDADSILSGTLTNRGHVSDRELRNAYERADTARRGLWRNISETAQAAVRLGVPFEEVTTTLVAGGVPKLDIRSVMAGVYNKRRITTSQLKAMHQANPAEYQSRHDLLANLLNESEE